MESETKEEMVTGGILMTQAASKITARDCAALSVLIFNQGEAPTEEWREFGAEAVRKFMEFGWTAYHALGGLGTNWDGSAANMFAKLRDGLPKRGDEKPAAKKTSKRRAKGKK